MNKKIIITFLITALIIPILFVSTYAANTVANATQSNTTTANKNVSTNSTENATTNNSTSIKTNNVITNITSTIKSNATKQTIKSNNANLSNLGITPNDFSGFKETKTEYNVSVPNNITEVEVYANKKDAKASITGTGKLKLEEGENTAKVVVTAEDGTTKTYTITIKRLKKGEKDTTSNSNSDLFLEKLEIKDVKLEPSFSKDIHQYKASFEGSQTNLEITAQPNQAEATVEIVGNEKFINGTNIITILVSNSKENEIETYQIYANRNLVEQDELNDSFNKTQKEYKLKQYIIIGLGALILILLISVFIIIHKKQKRKKHIEDDDEYEEEIKKLNYKKIEKNKKTKKSKTTKRSGRHSK